MSKVFITRSDLEKTVLRKKEKMTPFLFLFVWSYAIVCVFALLPIVFLWIGFTLVVVLAYLPFYFIDKLLFERKDNE